jgi:hypothetical protein
LLRDARVNALGAGPVGWDVALAATRLTCALSDVAEPTVTGKNSTPASTSTASVTVDTNRLPEVAEVDCEVKRVFIAD